MVSMMNLMMIMMPMKNPIEKTFETTTEKFNCLYMTNLSDLVMMYMGKF